MDYAQYYAHTMDALYEASHMFCFTTQYNQNITFEKPRTLRLRMSKNTGLKSEKKISSL